VIGKLQSVVKGVVDGPGWPRKIIQRPYRASFWRKNPS
jgi:hypothetical protein